MRSRLGPSGLLALVLVVSGCASGSSSPPSASIGRAATERVATSGAPGAPESGARLAAAVDAESASKPGGKPRPRTRLSGCNTDGEKYEACFSSPKTKGGKDPAVVRRFIEIFNSAGAGDTLRIAMFRWDIPDTTKALVAAQRRGAHVEIVADSDMTTKPAGRAVIAKIENGDPARRNVVVCRGSCLPWTGKGPAPPSQNVNHLKFMLAEIDGVKSVITSSSNFEGRQYSQVNSLTRVYDDDLFEFASEYFQRLRAQRWKIGGVAWRNKEKTYAGSPRAMVYPRRGDLVLDTLKQVRCTKRAGTINIMVAVIQRYDVRAQLGRLWKDGCKLRIITTRDLIENWLQKPFMLPNGQRVDINDNVVRTILTHDKVYAIHAMIGGRERHVVLTGTSNTTCGGLLYNDEMMLRLEGEWAFQTYSAHVINAFRHAHQGRSSVIPVQRRCR